MQYYAVMFDRITPLTPRSTTTPPRPGLRDAVNYPGFHTEFLQPHAIRRWWHYMDSLYIIGTEWSSQDLSEHFTKTAHAQGVPLLHLVLEVNLRNRFGWLPQDAWEWIEQATADMP
jgi:hypothetical protein